jgi:GT2 family glycosyltransferase
MSRISVCLASYNGERYIEAQLASIAKQLVTGDEIVISDDGSTDGTVRICEQIKSKFPGLLIVVLNGPRQGLIKNFANALAHASGQYIFLSDQDDVWLDTKVEAVLDRLRKCDLVVTDCKVVDSSLGVLRESFFEQASSSDGFVKNFVKNTYLGCCMAFNRNVLNLALPFPPKIAMHDWWIGLIAEAFGMRIAFLSEPQVLYRRHGGNASYAGAKSKASLLRKVTWRLDMLQSIFFRRLFRR